MQDDWGVQGYQIPKFNAFLDKSPVFKISQSKDRDFITELQKRKAYIPGPIYETNVSTFLKKKISFSKLPRITAAAEIMKRAEKIPAPG